MAGETRFFCRCGRLLTVDATVPEVLCPTCRTRNTVPRFGGLGGQPPPLPGSNPPRSSGAMPRATGAPPAASAGTPPPLPISPLPVPAPAAIVAATAVLELRLGGRLGRFELVRVLGQGGMGTVYHAQDGPSRTDVALKVLHPVLQGRPDFVTRFQRESRAAAALRHENIVRVLDAGIERGTPWIAMELVDGDDLLAAAQRGLVTPENAASVMLQAVRGLAAAAAQGITHRDIKPSNLLLRKDGVLKLADFGLAKAVDSSTHLTVTGEVLGTPHYMSPEQGRGEKVDHRSDLYSIGATFYHVLCGSPPHDADSPVAVIMKHLREEPLALRARNSRVAAGLERVIHRLLQKGPEQRYQTWAALSEDLERCNRGVEPIGGADPPNRRVQAGETTYLLPHEFPTELVLKPAGTVRRLLAFAVDLATIELTLRIWIFVSFRLFGAGNSLPADQPRRLADILFPKLSDLPPAQHTQVTILAATCLLAGFFYYAASDARGGRTLGKKWFNLRICRNDGRDLGIFRAIVRTLLLFPGMAMVVPSIAQALAILLPGIPFALRSDREALVGAGLAWLLALFFVGKISALGRPLHDAMTGAVAWRAERPRPLVHVTVHGRREVSPHLAMRLSVIPGVGLMYAGNFLIGAVVMAAIPTLFFLNLNQPLTFGLWIGSAFVARTFAERRRRLQRPALLDPGVDTPMIRRQES